MDLKKKYKIILGSSVFFGIVVIIGLANEKYILATVWGIAFLLHGIVLINLKCPKCGKSVLKRRIQVPINTSVYTILLPRACPSCQNPL
jgi:uncharacterized membrane protein HdeD (DUF308 family)